MSETSTSPGAPNFYYAKSVELDATVTGVELISTSNNPPFLWALEIDNTLNTVPVYVKFWPRLVSTTTIGSTAPTMQFAAAAYKKQTYSFAGPGPPLAMLAPPDPATLAEFSWACVLEPGTLGATSPPAAVPVRILFQQAP